LGTCAGIKYDPSIGIYGMDFYVVMGRTGERVAVRRRAVARVGFSHRVTAQETVKWFQQKVSVFTFIHSELLSSCSSYCIE
jgi:hypothetical protein